MATVRTTQPAEVHRMRPTSLFPGVLAAASLLVAAGAPAMAQDGATDRPRALFKSAETAIITNDGSDPAVNALVVEAAQTSIGPEGIQARREPWVGSLPEVNALQAARDWGEEEFDIVVLSGVPAGDTIDVANSYPSTVYVGVGQGIPCVSPDGIPDPSGTCGGDAATLVRNYRSSAFEDDEAGFLAGIVAASVSRNGRIGAIGGYPDCADCNRYIQGFERGVASVSPTADVVIGYLTDGNPEVANLDTETARAYAEAFIALNQLDVVLAASGGSKIGIIQAACDADALAIGTDVDRARAHPRLGRCTVTSAMRDYEQAIASDIFTVSPAASEGEIFVGGGRTWDPATGGAAPA